MALNGITDGISGNAASDGESASGNGNGSITEVDLLGTIETYTDRFLENLPTILITLVAIYILYRLVRLGLDRLEQATIKRMTSRTDLPQESEKRLKTLFTIFRKGAIVNLWTIGGLILLQVLGVPIGPILAGLGVFGLAISFGAQSLVRDVISGFFLIMENQVRIGDVAIINGTGGLVEQINLRTLVLRDLSGVVHVFPNGSITTLSNMTKDWSAVVLDIGVAYKEEVDKVTKVMSEVAAGMREDDVFKTKIIADMEIFGVESFSDSAVVIRGRIKTKPIEQWNVGREYRRRLKMAFDEQNIEIPFPHRTLYFGEASKAFEVLMNKGTESGALREAAEEG